MEVDVWGREVEEGGEEEEERCLGRGEEGEVVRMCSGRELAEGDQGEEVEEEGGWGGGEVEVGQVEQRVGCRGGGAEKGEGGRQRGVPSGGVQGGWGKEADSNSFQY